MRSPCGSDAWSSIESEIPVFFGTNAFAHLGRHDQCNQHSFYREAASFCVAFIKFYSLASALRGSFAAVYMDINHLKAYPSADVCIS